MRKQILFVDDDANFLDGIRRMLHNHREVWEIHFAHNVEEALDLAFGFPLDTIVTDLTMPGRNGFDLITALQGNEETKTVPVIVLTGNAEVGLKRQGLELGAADLLNKPVAHEDLVARLNSILRLKSYQDQLAAQNEILEERVRFRTMELEHSRRDILWRLAKAGEFRDEETGDHVMRVACFSRALAHQLGLPPAEVERIFLTSPLHDIGKIGVPDSILLKPGKLLPEERSLMEQHCEIGAAILLEQPRSMRIFVSECTDEVNPSAAADGLREAAAEIAMSHHEKWNGSGYPRKLAGEAIPLSGRIVAVADVYDALRSSRPYKDAFSVEKTLAIMREGRGAHFCPEVFDAFELVKDEFEVIRQNYSN